jgi:gas vesicle protein
MKKAFSFLVGLVAGAVVGMSVAVLLAPLSGSDLREQMRSRLMDLIEEGRQAASARRVELAAQLDAFKRGAPAALETPAGQPQG